jgi:hypothetical protein
MPAVQVRVTCAGYGPVAGRSKARPSVSYHEAPCLLPARLDADVSRVIADYLAADRLSTGRWPTLRNASAAAATPAGRAARPVRRADPVCLAEADPRTALSDRYFAARRAAKCDAPRPAPCSAGEFSWAPGPGAGPEHVGPRHDWGAIAANHANGARLSAARPTPETLLIGSRTPAAGAAGAAACANRSDRSRIVTSAVPEDAWREPGGWHEPGRDQGRVQS